MGVRDPLAEADGQCRPDREGVEAGVRDEPAAWVAQHRGDGGPLGGVERVEHPRHCGRPELHEPEAGVGAEVARAGVG